MRKHKIAMTGYTGFIGSRLLCYLDKFMVQGIGRCKSRHLGGWHRTDLLNSSACKEALKEVLHEVFCLVHLAGLSEAPDSRGNKSLDGQLPNNGLSALNVGSTVQIARVAAAAGVKRFIFISSIKVNGEQTDPGQPFQPNDEAKPIDPYGLSKWEAEQGLQQIAKETGMEVVIIRPPLVYGPGVKGNFANLIKLVGKGLPLPLGAIHNRRSLVALDNLVDLIITCIDHPNAANQVFLASDGQDLSTTDLLQGLAQAMGKPSRLFPIPGALLSLAASALGKKSIADRLLGSLQVDISKTQDLLNWTPPISVDEGLRRCFESQDMHS